MHNKLSELFGRFLLVLLFCSPLLITGQSVPRFKMLIAEELSYQFIQEAYDVGITEDSFLHYSEQMYKLGFTPKLSLEGITDSFSHEELIKLLQDNPVIPVRYTSFLSCELQSEKYVFRVGGIQ